MSFLVCFHLRLKNSNDREKKKKKNYLENLEQNKIESEDDISKKNYKEESQ